MSQLMEIGYFQFENLIRNRIPFLLVTFDVDFSGFYTGIFQSHLEKSWVKSQPTEFLVQLKKQNYPKEQSFVIVCKSGELSKKVAAEMESLGYYNTYCVTGGWDSLSKEKANS